MRWTVPSTFSRNKETEPWSGLRRQANCTRQQLLSQTFMKDSPANIVFLTSVRGEIIPWEERLHTKCGTS